MADADWTAYEELSRLMEEPALQQEIQRVYPVASTLPTDLDFSWLVDDIDPDDREADAFTPLQLTEGPAVDLDDPEEAALGSEELEAALKRNRQCQEAVRKLMESVERELAENTQRLVRLQEIRASNPFLGRETCLLLADPFEVMMKNAEKLGLSAGQVNNYKRLQEEYYRNARTWKWSKQQRRQLARGIRQQNQKILMDMILEGGGALASVQRELERIRHMSDRELETNLEGIDYARLANQYVPKKTPIDCEIQWRNVDHPAINKSEKWTEREIALLKEHGSASKLSWPQVAERLGTGRTAFDCAQEYLKRFQPHGHRGKWGKEEDEALKMAVSKYGESNWSRVASLVPGRTRHQCVHRWRKALSPSIRRGKWTQEEDDRLTAAIQTNPTASWQTIAQSVSGRTDIQCRERWTNVLDPSIKHTRFTTREDRILREAVRELGGGKWSAVADRLSGRTDNQCRRRWLCLEKMGARK